jgi:hypothetical protein
MKIHHAIVETLKKVEIVSTAKIMDILLAGVLRNVLTDMRRKLSRDRISKSIPKKPWIKWRRILKVVYEDPKYDSRWLSLGKETIMESIQLYSNHFIKKRRKILQRQINRVEKKEWTVTSGVRLSIPMMFIK